MKHNIILSDIFLLLTTEGIYDIYSITKLFLQVHILQKFGIFIAAYPMVLLLIPNKLFSCKSLNKNYFQKIPNGLLLLCPELFLHSPFFGCIFQVLLLLTICVDAVFPLTYCCNSHVFFCIVHE